MDQLKKYIEKFASVSLNEWETISKVFTKQCYVKNEIILGEGKICRKFYFLDSGLLRSFYNFNGNDVVKTFIFSPSCFTSEASFVNQLPANECIQAIEDSIVWQTDYENYKLLKNLSSWIRFRNSLLNEIDYYSKQMIIQLKSQTPEQRYFWLTQHYHQTLLQRIPQKYLASYLGVAPQSLCRIKNKLYRKGAMAKLSKSVI